jgi:hypothetical protein
MIQNLNKKINLICQKFAPLKVKVNLFAVSMTYFQTAKK